MGAMMRARLRVACAASTLACAAATSAEFGPSLEAIIRALRIVELGLLEGQIVIGCLYRAGIGKPFTPLDLRDLLTIHVGDPDLFDPLLAVQ